MEIIMAQEAPSSPNAYRELNGEGSKSPSAKEGHGASGDAPTSLPPGAQVSSLAVAATLTNNSGVTFGGDAATVAANAANTDARHLDAGAIHIAEVAGKISAATARDLLNSMRVAAPLPADNDDEEGGAEKAHIKRRETPRHVAPKEEEAPAAASHVADIARNALRVGLLMRLVGGVKHGVKVGKKVFKTIMDGDKAAVEAKKVKEAERDFKKAEKVVEEARVGVKAEKAVAKAEKAGAEIKEVATGVKDAQKLLDARSLESATRVAAAIAEMPRGMRVLRLPIAITAAVGAGAVVAVASVGTGVVICAGLAAAAIGTGTYFVVRKVAKIAGKSDSEADKAGYDRALTAGFKTLKDGTIGLAEDARKFAQNPKQVIVAAAETVENVVNNFDKAPLVVKYAHIIKEGAESDPRIAAALLKLASVDTDDEARVSQATAALGRAIYDNKSMSAALEKASEEHKEQEKPAVAEATPAPKEDRPAAAAPAVTASATPVAPNGTDAAAAATRRSGALKMADSETVVPENQPKLGAANRLAQAQTGPSFSGDA
jgi:hypothetical protein